MEVCSSSSQAFEPNDVGFPKNDENTENREIPTVESTAKHPNSAVELFPADVNAGLRLFPDQTTSSIGYARKIIRKKKKRASGDVSGPSSSLTSLSSQQRALRFASKRKIPKIIIGGNRHGESDFDALALPLGMSIAAVVAQVLDRKYAAKERIPADQLSAICTLAMKESLANVFGDKYDCFVRNFEKSFRSTLRTLRSINEASLDKRGDTLSDYSMESCSSEVAPPASLNEQGHHLSNSDIKSYPSEAVPPTFETCRPFSTIEERQDNMRLDSKNRELTLHGQINQQLACSSSTPGAGYNQSLRSTFEKSIMEQARSNDLKTFEIGLTMKQLQLKEAQLALHSDMNSLGRFKLSMGISKASFKAEKFKNELEDTRHTELLKKCTDCLVAGLIIMSASLVYGAYVYSYRRITEATGSCTSSPKESQSWWMPKPVASFSSGLLMLRCQIEVVSQMLFGVLMILAIAYLLFQRSVTSNQMMPVTFILLLLGVACGFVGKFCVDTLGGSGYHWLFYWEALCVIHFFASICTSAMFSILHGSISVSQGTEVKTMLPYWIRRFIFYASVLFLPLFGGLMPFASPSDWKDHFTLLLRDTYAEYNLNVGNVKEP